MTDIQDLPPTCKSDRKSTRLNSSHLVISYAVFCLKKKKKRKPQHNSLVSYGLSATTATDRGCGAVRAVFSRPAVLLLAALPEVFFFFFFFNDAATTEIYPLSLHDALPI